MTGTVRKTRWIKNRIKREQVDKYLGSGIDFIDDKEFEFKLSKKRNLDRKKIKDIFAKSLSIETLTLDETVSLISLKDQELLAEMKEVASKIKKKVYDNRIVTFAPLYLCNLCVNDCLYCGFRSSNKKVLRRVLDMAEVRKETEVLAGEIGHKRLIVVYGEDPSTDVEYMVDTIREIYETKIKTKNGFGQIRRVNINAPSLSIEELKQLKEIGIGTYQVFQETYHHESYSRFHPVGTIKGDYRWRLSCMHRAQEAGIDDVGIGALFGLYDWRFEVMGLLAHSRELEEKFGIGPHTISFPRIEKVPNVPFSQNPEYKVSDEDFKKIICILRLAIPYAGMIISARETAQIRREALSLGITQTDASSKIGIGAYSDGGNVQEGNRQQFLLGDTRNLEEVIGEFASMGYITSFCTAGYRCGRTGKRIMDLLKSGAEGKFCKLNAVLTFREWINDFAGDQTKLMAEKIIEKEIEEIKTVLPEFFSQFMGYYQRIEAGERDLYF
jgi:2-iminoacetate synthase